MKKSKLLSLAIAYASFAYGPIAIANEPPPIDFTRQIRPILSNKCFLCHGPAEDSREADLRLDQRDSALEQRADSAAIVPGDPEASELIARITSHDDSLMMPPLETKKSLSTEEIALLRRWIEEGAPYAKHWAFVPPERPTPPALSPEKQKTARNAIDHFVFNRLEQEGLAKAPTADQATLLRRLHLDLTGLPPSLEDIDQFLSNQSPDAYEHRVEQLLASLHYGERWARHWLDAARYADSDGYEKDLQRAVWPYRDWVIEAFNRDMPYNQFIVEQIAGDLLPGATKKQRIATGFLRNSMVNEEGGANAEQFRVEGLFDRMDAVGKAVLGITTQCAQCHSHKYDPLTHADYYGMFAFLNNCEESYEIAYPSEEAHQADEILTEVLVIETLLQNNTPDWRTQLAEWAAATRGDQPEWTPIEPTGMPFEGQKFRILEDHSILSESFAPTKVTSQFFAVTSLAGITAVRLELLTHPQLPGNGPGRSIDGTAALSEFDVFIEPLDKSQPRKEAHFERASADINPAEKPLEWPYLIPTMKDGDKRKTGPVHFAMDGDVLTAWTTDSGPYSRHQPRKAVFVAREPFGYQKGALIFFRINQSHGGDNADAKENYVMGRYRFSVTTAPNPIADPLPADLRELIETKSPSDWTDEEFKNAFSYWRTTVADWSDANKQIETLLARFPDGDFQPVARARVQPRKTHRLERGDFLSTAERIEPHTPDFLHPFPKNAPNNRLGFAQWLADRNSPTTARAIVNRIWQAYFGIGLVETTEDIGSQSPPASHPQLLDWLAVEFMDSGWSFKHLHRLILNSATYRQSSHLTPKLAEVDPRNRLLARGSRLRVDAEIVRDLALSASGLLNLQVGGRSVYPPAPKFLFERPTSYGPKNWFVEEDQQRYRRSMYVHAYRSMPYPPMAAFDAPKGDAACVRRVRSNTPLQALTLLNETQFIECGRALAQRIRPQHTRKDQPEDDASGLRRAFRLCVARQPTHKELDLLQKLLDKCRQRYQDQPVDACAVLGIEEDKKSDDFAERAAWTIVSRAILNLDETITKQ